MNKGRIIANLLVVGTSQVLTWALSIISLVLIGRYLGPDRLGELSLAGSVTAVLGLVLQLGMEPYIARSVARAPERTGPLVSAAIMVRAMVAIPLFGALSLYLRIGHFNGETRSVAYIFMAGMVLGSLGGPMAAALQGQERMSFTSAMAVIQNVLEIVLALCVIKVSGSVVLFALGNLMLAILLLLANLWWLHSLTSLTWRVSRHAAQELVWASLAFWATGIFLTIYISIDSMILAALAGTGMVGVYAPATRLFSVALFVPTILGAVTLPVLSRVGSQTGSDFDRAGRKMLLLLLVAGAPISVGLASFAGPLIGTLYGPTYGLSAPVLTVLSLSILPTYLNVDLSQMLAACDQQGRWTVIMAVSCIVNPLLNFALIPLAVRHWHNGALGAALALLATEVIMMVYGVVLLRRIVLSRMIGRVAAIVLVAALGQSVALWLAAPLWSPAGEILGVIAYAAIAVKLDALPREDMKLLWETATGRIPWLLLGRARGRAGPESTAPRAPLA